MSGKADSFRGNGNKKRIIIIIIVLAILVVVGRLMCGYFTCAGRNDAAIQNREKPVAEQKSSGTPSKVEQKKKPGPQSMDIDKKIQKKISEKMEKIDPGPEKPKKKKKDFEDEPVGNVVSW